MGDQPSQPPSGRAERKGVKGDGMEQKVEGGAILGVI